MHTAIEISSAIACIESSIREAERYCDKFHYEDHCEGDLDSCKYYVERSFYELLVLADRLNLTSTYDLAAKEFKSAKKIGFGETESYEGEMYSKWTGRVRLIADAIASSFGLAKTSQSEVQDLKAILKRAVYVICDTPLFANAPTSEADVHVRLEAILKCYYPDLKSKPRLTKPIKNFEPDTGLPSAKTLLEYKYISNSADAKRVADEILADASGYRSRDWTSLLFVIYETRRVKPEEEWQNLLKECQLYDGVEAIVLSGVARGAD